MTKPTVPPQDKNGELKRTVILLDRWRKQLEEKFPGDPVWQRYVAQSLLAGIPETDGT